jgi:tetratricopeptide (TPR) repeat protein
MLLRADAQGRFDCHLFLRQYYLEKLSDTTLSDTLDKHREYFLNFARAQTSANALELLDKERDNIRAAWSGASQADQLVSFVNVLETFLRHRGYRQDQLALAKRALDASRKEHNQAAVMDLLNLSAHVYLELGSLHEAQEHLDEALAVAESLGDIRQKAKALHGLGELYHQRGGLPTAHRMTAGRASGSDAAPRHREGEQKGNRASDGRGEEHDGSRRMTTPDIFIGRFPGKVKMCLSRHSRPSSHPASYNASITFSVSSEKPVRISVNSWCLLGCEAINHVRLRRVAFS